MYADDLILMTASVSHLQQLIILCERELEDIGLSLNVKKSNIIRVGKRYCSPHVNVCIGGIKINCCNELRYLGVYFKTGTSLQFNFEQSKRKFYAAVNGILSKVGNKPDIVLSLCNSFAIPHLLYGTEAMFLNKSQSKLLDNPLKRLFVKVFKTVNNSTIAYCQYYTSVLPVSCLIVLRSYNFCIKCQQQSCDLLKLLCSLPNVACIVNQECSKRSLMSSFVAQNNLIV